MQYSGWDLSADLAPVYSSGLTGEEEAVRDWIAERDQDLIAMLVEMDGGDDA
jgi:hypothetical protein